MRELVFRAAFPFGGSGGGARGFLDAAITLQNLGVSARFESVGGIDVDALACADFEYLTHSLSLCADVLSLTPEDLRKQFGTRAPDCVFMSPPCKGASALLSAAKSRTAKYQDMNELALVWTRLMLSAWEEHPPLLLLENVPQLKTRAAKMLTEVRRLLRRAGYVLSDGFHDCGELGGLAQRRRRYLLVARLPKRCSPFLYQPLKRRVRGCGEVLSELPMPGTPAALELGRMHELPRLSWRNWARLSLIPAGGDWRDLDGVLAAESWQEPTGTSNGGRSKAGAMRADNAPAALADLRVSYAFDAGYGVLRWEDAARTIAGTSAVGCGAYAVADPRSGRPEDGGVWTGDPRARPPFIPVIIAKDGTWHRPVTTLELAALNGFPLRVRGEPLRLAGASHSSWRERIGDAVPPSAARAIAERMLVTLAEAALGTFSLSNNAVWVDPRHASVGHPASSAEVNATSRSKIEARLAPSAEKPRLAHLGGSRHGGNWSELVPTLPATSHQPNTTRHAYVT
jgi:site-specific DNA-cytosine methylase